MELRTAASPRDVKHYTTERLREEFLIQNLFVPGEIKLVYSHIDRIITGAAVPKEPLTLTAGEELRAPGILCLRAQMWQGLPSFTSTARLLTRPIPPC